MIPRLYSSLLVIAAALGSSTASAQEPDVRAALAKSFPGVNALRGIDTDICFPANAVEYQGMGKNAILMVTSNSAVGTELPLRSVYLLHKDVRIPIQRLTVLSKNVDAQGGASQIAFYLIPIHYMKKDTRVLADFSGDRKGFGFMTFEAASKDENMPAFAKLDEYDYPIDPDLNVVAEVLLREYPDHYDELRQLGK